MAIIIKVYYFLKRKNDRDGGKKDEGGVLLPVLVLIAIFSVVLLTTVEDYTESAKTSIQAKDYYMLKTMEKIALTEINNTEEKKGTLVFNHGKVTYEKKAKTIFVWTQLKNGFDYSKDYPREDKNDTT